MNLDAIMEQFPEEEFLKADGLDSAIIGVEQNSMRLVYDIDKCIEALAQDMTLEDATEYFWYNTAGAYVGPDTPIFVHT